MYRALMIISLIFTISPVVCGSELEDPGPHLVGWREISFEDTIYGQGTITGRVYYPALAAGQNTAPDPGSGPYPLVGFQHGWLTGISNYDLICTHAASHGFVVASTGTETGLFPDHEQFARDTRSFLAWVDAESADLGSWLAGMAWSGDWGAFGHSMGGGALSLLVGVEPRVRAVIGLAPSTINGPGIPNMQAFTGSAAQVAGSADWIAPPSMAREWYDASTNAARSIWLLVEGMGHLGCLDNPGSGDPLPAADQARLNRRFAAGFLRAEVKGEEAWYHALIGEGMNPEPVERELRCIEPAFWAQESPYLLRHISTGLAGRANETALIMASLYPGSITTPFGEFLLNPSTYFVLAAIGIDASGYFDFELLVPSSASGLTLYLQGGVVYPAGGGLLSRDVEMILP